MYLCEACGEKIDESKKGNAKYLHPCNMVYIKVDGDNSGMKNIPTYKFGENIKFEDDVSEMPFKCKGCWKEKSSDIR